MSLTLNAFLRLHGALALLVSVALGCSSSSGAPQGPPDPEGAGITPHGPKETTGCATPNKGCACEVPGKVVDCGTVIRRSGSYVACSEGKRTCGDDKVWGDCIGDRVSTKSVAGKGEGDSNTKALGVSTPCKDNPCDPACQQYVDTPAGLVEPKPLAVGDAGISIIPDPTPDPTKYVGLTIVPNPATITVTAIPSGAAPVTDPSPLKLQAYLIPASGPNIAANAGWDLSNYNTSVIDGGGRLSVLFPIAGTLTATARVGTFTASAPVKVVVNANEVDPLVPAAVAALFKGGGGAADRMTVLYPYDRTVFPRGITAPVVQWNNNGIPATAVKVTLRYVVGGVDFTWSRTVPESTPPRYAIPNVVWSALDQTASGQTATISVQRVVGGKLLAAQTRSVTFSTAPLRGSIYYWEINRANIAKLDAGSGKLTPAWLKAGRCVGCHSVSADGSTIVAQDDGAFGPGGVFQASTGNVTYTRGGSANWQAISPTGKWTVWGNPGNLSLTGNANVVFSLQTALDRKVGAQWSPDGGKTWRNSWWTTGATIVNPAFSSDGKHIVFTSRTTGLGAWSAAHLYGNWTNPTYGWFGTGGWWHWQFSGGWGWGGAEQSWWGYSKNPGDPRWHWGGPQRVFGYGYSLGAGTINDGWDYIDFYSGQLWMADFAETAPYFFNVRQVASSTWERPVATYGSFTPDGNWLAFQRGDAIRTRNHLGDLHMVATSGAGGPWELANANGRVAPGQLTTAADRSVSYEPNFNPQASGGYNWVVFISNRSYGNTLPPCGDQSACGEKQMWVSAIDPSPKAGTDPSHPPFWLPGQEIGNQNMRGYWAKSPCGTVGLQCGANDDCCGYDPNPKSSTSSCRIQLPVTFPLTKTCAKIAADVCSKTGGPCDADGDCCNYTGSPQDKCVAGQCKTVSAYKYTKTTFVRDYVGTCAKGAHVIWRFFDWQTVTPGDSQIVFTVQSSETQGGLGSAPSVYLGTSSGPPVTSWVGADVGAALTGAGQTSALYLRVTATLVPSSDASLAPTLTQWRQNYSCPASE